MRPSLRSRVLFVSHEKVVPADPGVIEADPGLSLSWVSDRPEHRWIQEATLRIADWKTFVRSVYMRWAITINALHVARDRYAEKDGEVGLSVDQLAFKDGKLAREPMVIWSGAQAAANYESSIPLMASYGVQDMFGVAEEIIFDLYEIYLNHNPQVILEGPDFKEERKVYRDRENGPAEARAWETLWEDRLLKWRRKKLYSGLHSVFKSFWDRAGLKRPPWYKHTDIETWATTIEIFGELRNLITHGENSVSTRLEELVARQPFLGLTFTAGEELEVKLSDMMIMQDFLIKVLSTINLSLLQKGLGKDLPYPSHFNDG
jgi:hypothetical protein